MYSRLLSCAKAIRPGETARLTWNDIDFVSKTVRATPEKGSNPRIFPVSDKLLGMYQNIRKMDYIKDPERIYQRRLRHIRRNYLRSKIRLAEKVQNPRLSKIML
jgi:integrase